MFTIKGIRGAEERRGWVCQREVGVVLNKNKGINRNFFTRSQGVGQEVVYLIHDQGNDNFQDNFNTFILSKSLLIPLVTTPFTIYLSIPKLSIFNNLQV